MWGFYASLRRNILDSAGFILVDSSFRPIYANSESIKILVYPNPVSNPASLDDVLAGKIQGFLPRDLDLSQGVSISQFQSGRRLYFCRAFALQDHWSGAPQGGRIALILERGLSGPLASSKTQKKLAGMYEDPFSFSPDNHYYFFSRAHQEVFATLRSTVRSRRGVAVLLAQAGMGKTALLGCLSHTLRPETEIAFLPGSFDGRAELVRAVMASFGLKEVAKGLDENLLIFRRWLCERRNEGRQAVLFCDDGQDCSADALESLCMLGAMDEEGIGLLQIVIAGRQGLLEKLTAPAAAGFSERISVYCRLAPLDEGEVRSYVLHRLRIAGCTRQMFTSAALASVALYSRGIPLNVNMICRHSLSLAATINLPVIDDRIVADSAYDLVLRAQPANNWDDSCTCAVETMHPAGVLRDRRGLRLVHKP